MVEAAGISRGDPMVVFGISEKASELVLRVQWREGGIQTIGNIQPGFLYQVSPKGDRWSVSCSQRSPEPSLQWVSSFDTESEVFLKTHLCDNLCSP